MPKGFDERLHANGRYAVPIDYLENFQSMCNISIGTPPKEYTVLLDTASSRLWMPDLHCDDNDDDLPDYTCQDSLRIGNLTLEKQEFTGAGAVPGVHFSFDGVIGLGYQPPAMLDIASPFYSMLNQSLLDEPLFSLYLSKYDGSELLLGGIDKEHYHGEFLELPKRREQYWEADFDAISLGDQTVELETTGAIFDSATPFIALPEALAHVLNQAIGAKKGVYAQPEVDCSKVDDLPDLTFTLAGQNFTLTSAEYIIEARAKCISLLQGFDIAEPIGPVALLGVPFLRKWYSVYDHGKGVVGLGRAK